MNFKDKKLAVLHQLSQEAGPISLSEFLKKLGSEYIERSVIPNARNKMTN